MLANTKHILQKAQKGNYAVGHFNISSLETAEGVVRAAVKLKSPIILATSEGAIEYAGMKELYELALTASEENKIPIALHLDHGRKMEVIKEAISIGYSSVMIDASHEKFEKNVQLTKKVVRLAHKKGISVEAELGTIGGAEDTVKSRKILYTDPLKAKEFVERTGCDFLAVAVGTSHGAYKFKEDRFKEDKFKEDKFKKKAKLKISLLKDIKKNVKVPLVLHGASGVPSSLVKQAEKYGAKLGEVQGIPNAEIKKAVRNGINKINIDTDLRLAFDAGIREFLKKHPKDFDPRHMLSPARDLIQKVAEEKMKLFGSAGKG